MNPTARIVNKPVITWWLPSSQSGGPQSILIYRLGFVPGGSPLRSQAAASDSLQKKRSETMRAHTLLTKAASVAVCFGILISGPVATYGGVSGRVIRDVELSADGTLYGQVVTTEGHSVDEAVVELRFDGQSVASTASATNGTFAITGVRGGVHQLAVGGTNATVRLWQNGTAPKGAVAGIVVAGSETVVRGQSYDPYTENCNTCPPGSGFGLIDVVTLAMLGTSVAALVIAIDNNDKIDDLNNNVSSP
jgi:hypothetical protein